MQTSQTKFFGRGRKAKWKGGRYETQEDIILRNLEKKDLTLDELMRIMRPAPRPSLRRCLSNLKAMDKVRLRYDGVWIKL